MNTTEKAWRVLARKLMQANVRGPERDPRGAVGYAEAHYEPAKRCVLPLGDPRAAWLMAYSYARTELRALRNQAR